MIAGLTIICRLRAISAPLAPPHTVLVLQVQSDWGDITTVTAGLTSTHRIQAISLPSAQPHAARVLQVQSEWGNVTTVIAGLTNTYSSYVTTFEEYQEQRYEGASTIFGPHTLDAYIQVQLLSSLILRCLHLGHIGNLLTVLVEFAERYLVMTDDGSYITR